MSKSWKIGIDLGKRTGFAAICGSEVKTWVKELSGQYGERYMELEAAIYGFMVSLDVLTKINAVQMVVYEEPPYVRNMKTYGELCGYEAIIIHMFEGWVMPWYGINNRTLKKEMCGSGNADKKLMLVKACELAGREIKSQDEGDAILCAFYAAKLCDDHQEEE